MECDDGNTKNKDGCSSSCFIEKGWYCSQGSEISKDVCIDIVPPNFKVIASNQSKTITVMFTEKVKVTESIKLSQLVNIKAILLKNNTECPFQINNDETIKKLALIKKLVIYTTPGCKLSGKEVNS